MKSKFRIATPSFSLILALTLSTGCEVGEVDDLEELSEEPTLSQLEVGFSSGCIAGSFERQGNRVVGWAIDTCAEDPNNAGLGLGIQLVANQSSLRLGPGLSQSTNSVERSGRCLYAKIGTITCFGPGTTNRVITKTIRGRTYTGKYEYDVDVLGGQHFASAEINRFYLRDSYVEAVRVDKSLGKFPNAASTPAPAPTTTHRLTIQRYGNDVHVAGAGLSCTATRCTGNYAPGTQVQLSVTSPGRTAIFYDATRACTGPSCTLTMDQERNITAFAY